MTENTLYMLKAFFLGCIEGLTEFLPVSSTGHLILIGNWLNFNSGEGKVFEVVIQFGAILAVIWIFREKVAHILVGIVTGDSFSLKFARNIIIAFLPSAIIGVLFLKLIKQVLFQPAVVAVALVVGGFIILWVERRPQTSIKTQNISEITWKQALLVGCAQCLAMIPGTSRSGSTIIGGMAVGLKRTTATEFSFFLAMPTMLGASVYDAYKNHALLTDSDLAAIAVGFMAAFFAALLVVRALMRFVATHTYRVFAWYRIALGLAIVVWMLV
ncbi:undecaprenyl-diphosphatase [Pigmentiphaga litoralis]|uniref:undecaprenyl-diphosphate phosphatase n=1 Tax=Pigmentiphaga litoralis TaxID=516702 RepID=UPI00167B1656|nr:undecaprenyl-diphosphate phosphatase [Pigmentiphaga litoralis]GGX09733.1 undecaprenyl-diphosphatase [Pigmentiphaga litoralis]